MRKSVRVLMVTICMLSFIGCLRNVQAEDPAPTLAVVTQTVDLAKETNVTFMAKGFKAHQEFTLLFTDINGTQNDIGFALKPEAKADANGQWTGTWGIKRYLKAKVIKAGDYTVTLTDMDYNEIDSKTVNFFGKPVKKKKKKKK